MLRNALAGITVIDFTQIAAGPLCTMLLADMGARVIKVEGPEGDIGRGLGPAWIGDDSAMYHAFNRNKEAICVDLKDPAGFDVARRLIAQADVVVESMRPGAMNRLGLGYEPLAAEQPSLVYCSISAYGQSGPFAGNAGVDGILQADSGLMSLIGTPDGEPCKVQTPVVDILTGYVACMGILARLRERDVDGRGGHLDVNLLNSALTLQQASLASYLADGVLPTRIGSAAPYSAPNEAFECADGWIMVAAYHGDRWGRLCGVLGVPELTDDPRFRTSKDRVANRRLMRQLLTGVFLGNNTAHWLRVLSEADILCSRVSTYEDTVAHPQVASNGMIIGLPHPVHGEIRAPGFPINSVTENAIGHRPAPGLGEHGRDVLRGLGFSADDIERLMDGGAVREGAGEGKYLRSP